MKEMTEESKGENNVGKKVYGRRRERMEERKGQDAGCSKG